MRKTSFGTTKSGCAASTYEIGNGRGVRLIATDFGATVVSIFVKDKNGTERDVILGYDDYLDASKIIYEYAKDNENYKIKGGIIEGKVVSTEEIITLAKLPSRETLIAQLAGALLGNVTKLAVALDQVRLQKENA